MKQGTTTTFKINIPKIENIDYVSEIIFSFSDSYKIKEDKSNVLMTKSYPEDVSYTDGTFSIGLTQEETEDLPTTFYIEGQVEFVDKSVVKTDTERYIMSQTVNTTLVDGNTPSGNDDVDLEMNVSDVIELTIVSGDYNDLENKPSINGTTLSGDKSASDLNLVDNTEFDSLAEQVSSQGEDIENIKVSFGNGIEASVNPTTYVCTFNLKNGNTVLSTATIDLPLESVVVSGAYDSTTKEVVLTLQNGSEIRFSVADLVSGLVSTDTFNSVVATLQPLIDSTHKLNADLVDDTNTTNKFVTASEKTTWSGKQDTLTAGNGIDITGDTISVDLDTSTDNALDFSNGKLRFSKYNIGHDSDFRTFLVDNYYANALASKSYVDGLMSGAVKRQVVQTLPISDIDENTIYMLPKTTAETDNIYDEYMYINNAWELIGTTEVDLTDYVKNTDYSTDSKGGVIKSGGNGQFFVNANGIAYGGVIAYSGYGQTSNAMFISKGTLENILNNDSRLKEPQYVLLTEKTYTEGSTTGVIWEDNNNGVDDVMIIADGVTGTNGSNYVVAVKSAGTQYLSWDSAISDTTARNIYQIFERKKDDIYTYERGGYQSGTSILRMTGNPTDSDKITRVAITLGGNSFTAGTIKIYGRKRF